MNHLLLNTLSTINPCNISVTWTIILSVAGSIIFYFIEKTFNHLFAMPKVDGDDRLQNGSEDRVGKGRKYIRIYNKSRCDAYNTKVHVDFIGLDQQNNTESIIYNEDRGFSYLQKKTGEQLYTLFLNLTRNDNQTKETLEEQQAKKQDAPTKEKDSQTERKGKKTKKIEAQTKESDIKYILGKSIWMHVVITSQNQFGRVSKTADYRIKLSQEDRSL